MLDSSILKDLLAKDMDLVKKMSNNNIDEMDDNSTRIKGGMRRYRHKSEMVGEIAMAQKEYDEAKRRLHASKLELNKLRREAKVASAKSNVAKIKIKALLGVMRKMIAEGQSNEEEEEEEGVVEEEDTGGVETLIDRKLRNIAKMIPQYNASLDEVTKLARDAAVSQEVDVDNHGDNQNQYDDILREMMSIDSKTTASNNKRVGGGVDEIGDDEAWDSLIERMKSV